ncbi:cytochrome c [Arboricoccus pini]|uniref:Cytochrome c n=1 Tax=Arboricoccus pini TaxID=1963835 RepID=A0A212RT23_9PROT|nr:cytochrome c family protein [Arboricoccus pini]SNB75850.1 cytochrome c [Arboricoccus pini]
MIRSIFLAASLTVGLVGIAHADGDPAKGEKVFARCKACHNADSDQNKIGPHLSGVVGRKAGSVADFDYSDAMKNSGLTWDEATLTKYLKDPKGVVPNNKMAFTGLKKDDEIANVIAYLKTKS